jgi:L,D-transpeptidase-like protein
MHLKSSMRPGRVPVVRLILSGLLVTLPAMAVGARKVDAASSSSAIASSLSSPSAWADVALGGIDPQVFSLALEAAASAVERGQAGSPSTLTVIDYSKPSTEKRMWVYDLRSRALLFHELVSHGRGSGLTLARSFSNLADSNKTSLGLFRTAEAYIGHNGYSVRLDGLEPGVNDRARDRAIVIHGAPYVNAVTAKANGYLGRSLGCPAVRPEIARELIDAVKGGGLLFAYYPDQDWLKSSRYLN